MLRSRKLTVAACHGGRGARRAGARRDSGRLGRRLHRDRRHADRRARRCQLPGQRAAAGTPLSRAAVRRRRVHDAGRRPSCARRRRPRRRTSTTTTLGASTAHDATARARAHARPRPQLRHHDVDADDLDADDDRAASRSSPGKSQQPSNQPGRRQRQRSKLGRKQHVQAASTRRSRRRPTAAGDSARRAASRRRRTRRFSFALPGAGPDRRPELLHRHLPDPAVPAADLPGGRDPVRRAVAGAGGDQRDRDRLRPQPVGLDGRRRRLDAVPALDVEAYGVDANGDGDRRSVQPGRRDLHRRPLPARGRRVQEHLAGDLRLQPRRLVRPVGAAAREADRRDAERS